MFLLPSIRPFYLTNKCFYVQEKIRNVKKKSEHFMESKGKIRLNLAKADTRKKQILHYSTEMLTCDKEQANQTVRE